VITEYPAIITIHYITEAFDNDEWLVLTCSKRVYNDLAPTGNILNQSLTARQ
jgi:hypothetical protein